MGLVALLTAPVELMSSPRGMVSSQTVVLLKNALVSFVTK